MNPSSFLEVSGGVWRARWTVSDTCWLVADTRAGRSPTPMDLEEVTAVGRTPPSCETKDPLLPRAGVRWCALVCTRVCRPCCRVCTRACQVEWQVK